MRVKRARATASDRCGARRAGWARAVGVWGAATVALWACSDDAPPDLGDPVEALDLGELRGTFDDRGGRMEGAVGGPLEGVSVELPQGALRSAKTLVVRTAWDAAPLPERAFAVGPQIELTTEDGAALTFARPVTVTLPAYPERVRSFDVDVAGVKVWRQGPDGWALVEPIATTATRVAIELEQTALTGAGVKLDALPVEAAPCVAAGACFIRAADPTCADNTALCLAPVLDPDPDRLEALVAAGPAAVVLVQRRASAAGVVLEATRLDLDTGAQTASAPLPFAAAADADRVHGAALDPQGDLWVGLRRGVARLAFSGAPSTFAPGYEGALAHHVAAHPSGQPLWVTRDRGGLALSTLRSDGAWAPHGRLDAALSAPVGALDASITAAVLHTPHTTRLLVATHTTPDPVLAFDLTPGDPTSPAPIDTGLFGPLLRLHTTATPSPQALWIRRDDLTAWTQDALSPSAQQNSALTGSAALAPDLLGGLWGALADIPALVHSDARGFPTLTPLGDSSDAAAQAQRGARALLSLDPDTLVILTRDGALFALHTP